MKHNYSKEEMNFDISNQTVGVIGYGIQGRNQAHNLRDSGINVLVYNRNDEYLERAKADGFNVVPIEELARNSDIIMMLIADQAQKSVYETSLHQNMKQGAMLVIAHGYSITFGGMKTREDIDVVLLAPRFPGQVIRENFLAGGGTLAFFDSYHDVTGTGKKRGLALAKAIGLTNLLQVGLEEETYADLFIENFLIPRLRGTIEECYKLLVNKGISKEVAALEAYQSGEILGLLTEGINSGGMYHPFHTRTSPTCQFGVANGYNSVNKDVSEDAEKIWRQIVTEEFSTRLAEEEKAGYPKKNSFNKNNQESEFAETLNRLREQTNNEQKINNL